MQCRARTIGPALDSRLHAPWNNIGSRYHECVLHDEWPQDVGQNVLFVLSVNYLLFHQV